MDKKELSEQSQAIRRGRVNSGSGRGGQEPGAERVALCKEAPSLDPESSKGVPAHLLGHAENLPVCLNKRRKLSSVQ